MARFNSGCKTASRNLKTAYYGGFLVFKMRAVDAGRLLGLVLLRHGDQQLFGPERIGHQFLGDRFHPHAA
jgi:hypothetical protein